MKRGLDELAKEQAEEMEEESQVRIKGRTGSHKRRQPVGNFRRPPANRQSVRESETHNVAQPWEGLRAGEHPLLPLKPPGRAK